MLAITRYDYYCGVYISQAAGFKRPISDNKFYLRYFPHQIGVSIADRKTYHTHNITSQVRYAYDYNFHYTFNSLTVLDSWVHVPPVEQVDFIRSALARTVLYSFALYHMALYPSKDVSKGYDHTIASSMMQYWEPLFSTYNLTAAFENHFHAFKQSFPMKFQEVVQNGTYYLGDGSFGVGGSSDWVHYPFIERVTGEEYVLLHLVLTASHVWIVRMSNKQVSCSAITFRDSDVPTILSSVQANARG